MDDHSTPPPPGWQPSQWRLRLDQWLDETDAEIRRLGDTGRSDFAAATAPGNVGSAEEEQGAGDTERIEADRFNLISLVEAFTAMRHELKLQTKASRGQQQGFQAAIAHLERVAGDLQTLPQQEQRDAECLARPLVLALLDLSDALGRAVDACQTASSGALADAPASQWLDDVRRERFRLGWLGRKLAGPSLARLEAAAAAQGHAADRNRLAADRLLEGLRLIQQRLSATCGEQGIEPIAAVGQPFDPHRMQAVEVVDATTAKAGTVVDVVRAGYRWREQVIRFAEVRVARAEPQHRPSS